MDAEGQCFAHQPDAAAFTFSCTVNDACTTSVDLALGIFPSLAVGPRTRPLVLCTGSTPTLCVASTGVLAAVLNDHAGAITCHAVEPCSDSDLIAAGSVDGTVSLWHAAHFHSDGDSPLLEAWGGLNEQLPCFVGTQVTAVAISSPFDLLAVGCADGCVHTARISNPAQVVNKWSVADGQPVSWCPHMHHPA